MAKKLIYFDSNGIAECVRYMLHYGKQKFEDVRYDYKTWPVENVKKTLPFGQLPFYEEGKKTLNQSLAIARYVAATNNLLPSDPWDQAQLDAIVFSVYDFWAKIVTYLKEQDPVKKQMIRKEIFDEVIDFYFSRFDSQLKHNKGFFGGKGKTSRVEPKPIVFISWADFVFVGIVEAANLQLREQIECKYPNIVALMEKIRTLPGVKEYISKRKPYLPA